jgi:hypothetical protein
MVKDTLQTKDFAGGCEHQDGNRRNHNKVALPLNQIKPEYFGSGSRTGQYITVQRTFDHGSYDCDKVAHLFFTTVEK